MQYDRDEDIELEAQKAAELMDAELQKQTLAKDNVDQVLKAFLPAKPALSQAAETQNVLNEIEMFTKRIELVNLYRALLNQTLFGPGGDDALKAAVEKEVRGFVVTRLKDLLGIAKPPVPQQAAPKQFNEKEERVLKIIASKVTGESPSPTSTSPRINPVNLDSGPTVVGAPLPPELAATIPAKPQEDNRGPLVDPQTGEKRPNPRNVGQVGQLPNGAGPKPAPMPSPQQEVAKIVSEITNAPVPGSGKEATALSLAIAKAIHNAQSKEE